MTKRTLSQLLDGVNDHEDDETEQGGILDTNDEQNGASSSHIDGMCIECGDQPASLFCEQCCDDYCDVCFAYLHKKGTRKKHTTKPIQLSNAAQQMESMTTRQKLQDTEGDEVMSDSVYYTSSSTKTAAASSKSSSATADISTSTAIPASMATYAPTDIAERAKYIPLRLSLGERKALRLLEAAMKVSEYTDKVDIISFKSKTGRINAQVKDICAILSGLVVASDYAVGQQLIKDKNFADNERFFQKIFEVGRRHKIMNPEKMRSEYGKLVYMLMDTELTEVQQLLGFSCVRDIKMVYNSLAQRGASQMLSDELVLIATAEIIAEGKSRDLVQREIKQKEKAIEHLSRKYANTEVTPDELKICLYSIGDNNAFLRQSRDSCEVMLRYLTSMFSPSHIEDGYSLAIRAGQAGHRLTHSHERQYHYVFQSLTLWREILHDMFKLWYLCEQDLLDCRSSPYRLRDTGQGLNRVQSCPRIGKAMHNILYKVQRQVGENWVGSSVIHLGDHNVPNALMFIDKYSQVPRILNPIVTALGHIDGLVQKDKNIAKYINSTYGDADSLKKEILADFFRSGFDGSGADNFMDAGSCIDGRLTSAWNWCSQIEKKRFFPVFLLTGFIGFDGEFA